MVITGCSGFVGANLAIAVAARGGRVIGVESSSGIDWRTRELPGLELVRLDLCQKTEVPAFIEQVQPLAIYNCAAYGAYSVQADPQRIFDVNLLAVRHLLEAVRGVPGFQAFVQAGSSSEYGFNCSAPREDARNRTRQRLRGVQSSGHPAGPHVRQKHGVPGFVLRLYSVYGPYEDFSRLIPSLLGHAREGRFPPLVNPRSLVTSCTWRTPCARSRPFAARPRLRPGEVFNVGSGVRTTLGELVQLVRGCSQSTPSPVGQHARPQLGSRYLVRKPGKSGRCTGLARRQFSHGGPACDQELVGEHNWS